MANRRQINVEVSAELVDWFEEAYPMHGAKTWFIEACFRRFKEQHEVTPEELVKDGIRALRTVD